MDCQQMFDQANNFYAYSKLCEEKARNRPVANVFFMAPLAVNLSFACEIYLKTLLNYHRIEVKQHKLNNLFDSLPDEDQGVISETLHQRYPFRPIAAKARKIDLVASAFTEWRYSYEMKELDCDIGYLKALAKTLRDACSTIVFGLTWDQYCKIVGNDADLWG